MQYSLVKRLISLQTSMNVDDKKYAIRLLGEEVCKTRSYRTIIHRKVATSGDSLLN